jgi:hypothetical protein
MSEQYLVDTTGKTIGVVIDPETYRELVQAREELERLRTTQHFQPEHHEISPDGEHSIRELRGLGKELWSGLDVQSYIRQERGSWDG